MYMAQDLSYSYQALAALFAAVNKLQMLGDRYLKDLTVRQMLAIPALFHAPDGKATINHIARSLGVTKQSAKQIVDVLEKKKYVSAAPSERDKRAVNVAITPEGERAFSVCSERADLFVADIFSEFSAEELEIFLTLLRKLYKSSGPEQGGNDASPEYHKDYPETIMQHHQNFAKRRTDQHD